MHIKAVNYRKVVPQVHEGRDRSVPHPKGGGRMVHLKTGHLMASHSILLLALEVMMVLSPLFFPFILVFHSSLLAVI